eukprot:11115024-Heterocapsa_arctica.AAC.1
MSIGVRKARPRPPTNMPGRGARVRAVGARSATLAAVGVGRGDREREEGGSAAVDVVNLRLLHAVVLVALVLDHHAHDVHDTARQGAEAAVDVVELRLVHVVVRVANREVR